MEYNKFKINKTLNIKLIYLNKNIISNMLNFANVYLLIYGFSKFQNYIQNRKFQEGAKNLEKGIILTHYF